MVGAEETAGRGYTLSLGLTRWLVSKISTMCPMTMGPKSLPLKAGVWAISADNQESVSKIKGEECKRAETEKTEGTSPKSPQQQTVHLDSALTSAQAEVLSVLPCSLNYELPPGDC